MKQLFKDDFQERDIWKWWNGYDGGDDDGEDSDSDDGYKEVGCIHVLWGRSSVYCPALQIQLVL